ncbi:unnamed protein product [Peronospora belbahrii]|uniref:Uncharacterized protein n=1 Tax=Peronospora belbahrii TaxID=622444 RepID=A0AAU9KU96_9STRA|nr:unnamed protein product [Peronospora belbahrii]
MGNRGRRRSTHAANRTDLRALERMEKQKPIPQSELDESRSLENSNQLEIQSIRWKRPQGPVVIQYKDGSHYKGSMDDEERRHGTGVYILRSGHIFEGGWVHGDFEGFGMQTFSKTGDCHEGMYCKNYRHGTGTYLWANGDKYVGNWRAGKMHGIGTFFWKNGDFYNGEWKRGMMHGKGKKIFSTGEMIDGAWRHNQASGWGSQGGESHEGTWCQGRMHGKGVYVSAGGSLHGTWLSDKLSGQGVHYFQCGSVYTGEYKASERNGIGTLTFASGEVYEGEWHMGEIHGYGSWSSPDGRKFIGTWIHGFPSGRGIFCYEHDENQDEEGGHIAETRSMFEVGEFRRGRLITRGKQIVIGRLAAPS